MERRSSLRRPIHHDAQLRLDGGAIWPCVIADYCSEGMFLKFSLSASVAIESDLSASTRRTFTILFTGSRDQHFELLISWP